MKITKLQHVKEATAILTACMVAALNDSDPSFEKRFLDRLDEADCKIRDSGKADIMQEVELLAWTRSLVTGFTYSRGRGEPFFEPR